jgi:hypothetical protein
LAREIAGPDANAETQDLARQVAEAQIDLRRVRYARHKLLSDALADPHYDRWREKMAVLRSLLRGPDVPVENLEAFLNSTPQGPHKFTTILSQRAKQLLAMERYERRALSRRKSPIRAFDETRRWPKIAIIKRTICSCTAGRTKPKSSIFSMNCGSSILSRPGEHLIMSPNRRAPLWPQALGPPTTSHSRSPARDETGLLRSRSEVLFVRRHGIKLTPPYL